MAFNHRKLLAEPVDNTSAITCTSFCDPTNNKDGICPFPCLYRCSSICQRPFSSQNLQPPDHFTTTQDSDPPPNKHHKIPIFLTISLSIFAFTFFLFFCYTAYRFYKGWYRSRQRSSRPQQVEQETRDEFLDEDHGPLVDHPIWYIRTIGLQPSVISAITVCKYKKGEGVVEGTECSVCLNEFLEDETLRLLPKCNHAFHIPCIDTWLRSHTNCPLCRAGIVVNTAAALSSPEQIVDNSGIVDETQVGDSVNNREIIREREDELSVGIEEDGLQGGNGTNSDENLKVLEVDEVFQPMRRSVSLDSLSASLITTAIITKDHHGNSNTQLVNSSESNKGIVPKIVDQRSVGSPSIGGSGRKRPIPMNRSSSCSGKVLLSRNGGRSRNSVLPS